jgi:endonuclease/exonuclease/phosphatase family metal-dependent hydrolase
VTSSGRSELLRRILEAIVDRLRSVGWVEVVPVVLVVALVGGLGLYWASDREPAPVLTAQTPVASYDADMPSWLLPTEGSRPHATAPSEPLPSPAAPKPSKSARPSRSAPAAAPQSVDPSSVPSVSGCLVPRQLSVLTFNIHGGRTDHGVDLPAVAAEIRAAHADVVLLQEVDRNLARTGYRDEPGVLAGLLDMDVYYQAPVRSNAILTRYPVTEWSSTPLPLRPGREERRLVHATVLVGGQAVNVFTTHLDQSYADLRVQQIRAAEQLMAPYADQPTILGGDLNSPATGAVLNSLRERLRDSWAEVGSGAGNTVPAGNPRIRIDYLLHNSWLTPRAAQVLPSRASDHRPLRVMFDLWGEPDCTG